MAKKQQIYQVVPFAMQKILLGNVRESAVRYFGLSGQGRLLLDGFEAVPD